MNDDCCGFMCGEINIQFFQKGNDTWSGGELDITTCFKQSVLIWAPCSFLWLYSFIDIRRRYKSRFSDIPWSFLNVSKSLMVILLISLSVTEFWMMISVRLEEAVYPVHLVSARVKIATFVSN